MVFDVEQHVCYRIANAPMLRYPFPHFYVDSIFPEDFYRELRARLPSLDSYTRIDETGTVAKGNYQARYVCSLTELDRKSTRLNSSHLGISYAVFCLKKKNKNNENKQ